jgi:uncharacterized cupredoxin-like copper-binding protein
VKRIMIGAVAATAIAAMGTPAQAGRDAAPQARQSAKLVATVKVTAKDLSFTLSAKSAKRGLVIFKVTNAGALEHDFSIKGRTTKKLKHGQSNTLRITFVRKGSYPYKCTVPGHAAAGMKGVFTIK